MSWPESVRGVQTSGEDPKVWDGYFGVMLFFLNFCQKKGGKNSNHFKCVMLDTMIWLIAIEYLCHKWTWMHLICHTHNPGPFFNQDWSLCFNKSNTMGATNGSGTATLTEHPCSPPVFSIFFVPQCLFFWVVFWQFVDQFLSFCSFYFGNRISCHSSIYDFWLPLCYLQTFF